VELNLKSGAGSIPRRAFLKETFAREKHESGKLHEKKDYKTGSEPEKNTHQKTLEGSVRRGMNKALSER